MLILSYFSIYEKKKTDDFLGYTWAIMVPRIRITKRKEIVNMV